VLNVQGGVFLGAFAVLAGLCWISARVARRMAAPVPAPAQGGMKLITNVLPYVSVVFAAFMPLAAGLYLATTVAWSTVERWFFARRAAHHERADARPAR
jgi:YidC/Oxa1 family membrane protein insertase